LDVDIDPMELVERLIDREKADGRDNERHFQEALRY